MLKIGEFSRLGQVIVKTLHYYDNWGLLHPAHIDQDNGYRFYTVDQLPRLHRIMALKELGLSLEQIGPMLDEDVPIEQIRGMLRLKQAEIQQQMGEAQKQLSMVEFRLRMVEAEFAFPDLDVVIKSLEPMRALSVFIKPHHTMEGMAKALTDAFDQGIIRSTGVFIDVFHGETIIPLESPELKERQHEILLGVEPSQESITIKDIGHLTVRDEPDIETAATLILTNGDQGSKFEKVALLLRWAVAHGYKPRGLVRYLHHRGPIHTLNRDEFVIEAQLAVDADE
jgi:DNA-binding transcriptional MerR regulator